MEIRTKLRSVVTHKIVAPAVVLASLGIALAAAPMAQHSSAAPAALPRTATLTACVHNRLPWMYASRNQLPWMYAVTNQLPWMYAVMTGHPATARAACAAAPSRLPA